MYYTIYKITNKINDKFYIGKHQTQDLNDSYMGSGKLLKRAINKYGIENFSKEILFVFETEQEMNDKEKELVVLSEMSYNLCEGGHGGFGYINKHNLTNTKLGRKKTDEILLNKYNVRYPGQLEKSKKINSDRFKTLHKLGIIGPFNSTGIKLSEAHKRKIGLANSMHQKNNSSQLGTCWITNGTENKKIKKDEVDKYVPLGYYKGRKLKK